MGMVAGDLEHRCLYGQDLKSGLCGDQLSELLKFLCGNDGYNGFDKRSAIAPELAPFTGMFASMLYTSQRYCPSALISFKSLNLGIPQTILPMAF